MWDIELGLSNIAIVTHWKKCDDHWLEFITSTTYWLLGIKKHPVNETCFDLNINIKDNMCWSLTLAPAEPCIKF